MTPPPAKKLKTARTNSSGSTGGATSVPELLASTDDNVRS